MALKRCDNGHYFDPATYSSCPSCGYNLDFQTTQVHRASAPDTEAVTRPMSNSNSEAVTQARTVPKPKPQVAPVQPQVAAAQQRVSGITVAIVRKKTGMDPVVGWLVCVDGSEKGRDYRIRSEKNYIGRDASMDICISGDETISRENHAVISFNPRNVKFTIAPGTSRGIVYLNNDEVGIPTELKPYDLIEVGQCKLLFVSFCNENFQWAQES